MLQRCTAGRSCDKNGSDPGQKTKKYKSKMSISSFILKEKGPRQKLVGDRQRCRISFLPCVVPISVWRTLCSCDRSGRGDGSPAGSTVRQAYQTAAYRTPKGRGNQGERWSPWNAYRGRKLGGHFRVKVLSLICSPHIGSTQSDSPCSWTQRGGSPHCPERQKQNKTGL